MGRRIWTSLAGTPGGRRKLALAAGVIIALPGGALAAASGGEKWQRKAAFGRVNETTAVPDYDVRRTSSGRRAFAAPSAGRRAAQGRLRGSLGRSGVLKVDPATGTPAYLANRTGFLTGPRRGGPDKIALGFVRANSAAFGLDAGDLARLAVAQRYTTKRGLTHIDFVQRYRGIDAFDNGLRVNLIRGRLVNVAGSPQPDLAVSSTKPRLSAAMAVGRALADVGVDRPVRERSQ